MNNLYEQLGFTQPNYVKNVYGIKILLGTKGENDWCIVIPRELVEKKCRVKLHSDFVMYLESEETVLLVAKEYTEYAKYLEKVSCEVTYGSN